MNDKKRRQAVLGVFLVGLLVAFTPVVFAQDVTYTPMFSIEGQLSSRCGIKTPTETVGNFDSAHLAVEVGLCLAEDHPGIKFRGIQVEGKGPFLTPFCFLNAQLKSCP